MLHYLVCAAIAYFLALYLNSRFPGWFTAVWSSGVAAIVGIVVGSGLVLGGMALMGIALDPGAVAGRGFAQAIIWSVAGTAAGIYHGRQKAAKGEHGNVTSIPMKAWLGWGALSIAVVFVAIALAGKVSASKPSTVAKSAPQAATHPASPRPVSSSLEGPPSFEDAEHWTQESTKSTDAGPWLQYSPPGSRYCRLADRTIITVFPPGVKPQAEKANPFCATASVSSPDQL